MQFALRFDARPGDALRPCPCVIRRALRTLPERRKEYIYFAGRQIAWRDSSGNVYYEFADALGSTRVVTDSTGHSCFDTDYYPYGQESDHTATCPPTNRFTGYEYDSETGNYYAFFRYYSPRLGRFMTPDPLGGDVGSPQSLNRYSYLVNNPLKYSDPLGLRDNLCVPDCVEEGGPGSYGGLGLGAVGPDDTPYYVDGFQVGAATFSAALTAGFAAAVYLSDGTLVIVGDPNLWVPYQAKLIDPGTGQVLQVIQWAVFVMSPAALLQYLLGSPVGPPEQPSWWGTFARAFFSNLVSPKFYEEELAPGGCLNAFAQAASGGGILPDLPAGSGADDLVRNTGRAAAASYAVNRALTTPLRSSIYRELVEAGETGAALLTALDFFAKSLAGANAEREAIGTGACH